MWLSTLTEHRIELLDSIGFDWGDVKGEDSWDKRYEELKEFWEQNGHSNYSTKLPGLGRWVSTQREKHKDGTLSKDHYKKLRKIDFEFDRAGSRKKAPHG